MTQTRWILIFAALLSVQVASAESIGDKLNRLRQNAFFRQECKASVQTLVAQELSGGGKIDLVPTDRNEVIQVVDHDEHGQFDIYEATVNLDDPSCPTIGALKNVGGLGN